MRRETNRRLDPAALAAGLYPSSAGYYVPLAELHDAHLVNALLKALSTGEPETVTQPLAAEVDRRGLRGRALAEAERREEVTR